MIGEATTLAVPVEVPAEVSLRRLDPDGASFIDDAHRMAAMHLERSGLSRVTTTTPFVWQRVPAHA